MTARLECVFAVKASPTKGLKEGELVLDGKRLGLFTHPKAPMRKGVKGNHVHCQDLETRLLETENTLRPERAVRCSTGSPVGRGHPPSVPLTSEAISPCHRHASKAIVNFRAIYFIPGFFFFNSLIINPVTHWSALHVTHTTYPEV